MVLYAIQLAYSTYYMYILVPKLIWRYPYTVYLYKSAVSWFYSAWDSTALVLYVLPLALPLEVHCTYSPCAVHIPYTVKTTRHLLHVHAWNVDMIITHTMQAFTELMNSTPAHVHVHTLYTTVQFIELYLAACALLCH